MPWTEQILQFLEQNKVYLAGVTALNSVVNLLLITFGLVFFALKWRELKLVAIGPLQFQRERIRSELEEFQKSAGSSPDSSAKGALEKAINRATEPGAAGRMAGKTILWVDDNPENNRLAVRALSRLRIHVENALTTEDALRHLDRNPDVDLIISDMGRRESDRAGYELLEQIRARGIKKPFAIFAGSDSPAFRQEAAKRGAQLSTNDVGELLNFITQKLAN